MSVSVDGLCRLGDPFSNMLQTFSHCFCLCTAFQYCNGGDLADYLHSKYTTILYLDPITAEIECCADQLHKTTTVLET